MIKLLRQDGDIGDPLPSSVTLGIELLPIIPDGGGGDQIATVHWTVTATNGGCANNYDLGTDVKGIVLKLASLGTVVIKADFTYQPQMTWPPTPVGPNSVSATIIIIPPSGFHLVPFDQTVTYNFGAPNNAKAVQFLLLNGQENSGGYYMGACEKINYIIPANAPPDFGGGRGGSPPLLQLNLGGTITDYKGLTVDNWPNVGPGQPLFKYTQTVGVYYVDWCGVTQYSALGTVTVTHRRSAVDKSKWLLQITQP